jgi:uncharacterized membrane protein YqhA
MSGMHAFRKQKVAISVISIRYIIFLQIFFFFFKKNDSIQISISIELMASGLLT